MEITATIVDIFEDYIRVRTVKKKQEIDVFFTPEKKEAVHERYEPIMVTRIEVEVQTVDVLGNKYAKLWLRYVISPELRKFETLVGPQIEHYNRISPLYSKK